MEKFKYLGVTVTNTSVRKLKVEKTCEKFIPRLLFKKLKVNTHTTITLPTVLNGCETWILTFREERRLRVFENKVFHHHQSILPKNPSRSFARDVYVR